MTRPIRLLTAVLMMLAIVSCGDGTEGGASTTVPSTVPSTTTAPSSTTVAPSTTQLDTNALAEGSGCTPGEGDLPDGLWFGYVGEATPDDVGFDLACMFSGDAAALAATEDGEESPPPNDYYVRNVNTALRTVTVAAGTEVLWYPNIGDPTTGRTDPYATWQVEGGVETESRSGSFPLGVWLTVEDGAVTHIEEFWAP